MPLVEVSNVTWRYTEESRDVLHDVSLTIAAGEFLGIMGATGAGKTTLAEVIRGIIPGFHEEGKFSGTVVVGNVDVAQSEPQRTADDIGMVFQDAGSQIVGTSVLQDATFGPANLGLDRGTVLERARNYLARVKLSGLEQRPSSALSGGQQQRLAIAGVLAMEPRVLVLDEPVAELDPIGRREVAAILTELRQVGGATVILVEQDPEIVAQFCDRVVIVADGVIARQGTPVEVFADPAACLDLGVYVPEAAILDQRLRGTSNGGQIALTPEQFLGKFTVRAGTAGSAPEPAVRVGQPASAPIVVELRNVSFSYDGRVEVLTNASLQIESGEYVAIVGSNGAGKTTLSKQLNGLRRPSSGTVLINGRDIAGVDTSQIALEVGYCFQNPDHQIFSKTVLEEVMFGPSCQGMDEQEARSRAEAMLARFGIGELAEVNPHSLGKGERQKVALASILVLEPAILVIDEPTTGLDWTECQQILDIIGGFRDSGTTVIAITHDMRLARERASRVVAMSHGSIIFDGEPAQFFLEEDVMRRADVEPPALSVITAGIARTAGLDPRRLPVALDDLVTELTGIVSPNGVA